MRPAWFGHSMLRSRFRSWLVGYAAAVLAVILVSLFIGLVLGQVNLANVFTVSDPEEWVSLLFFLLTATATGQLAAGRRSRAREAQEREREAVVLYDVVRLLGQREPDDALKAVA